MPIPHAIPSATLNRQIERNARNAAELEQRLERYLPTTSNYVAGGDKSGKGPSGIELPVLRPITGYESKNVLRPRTLADMIGQEKLKPLIRRLIDAARATGRPLGHILLVGASGTGKTTLATVIANEIGTRVFSLKAPVDALTLMALREATQARDVVFLDEIHMQVSGDRRGITQTADPESFYMLLEDGMLSTPVGPLTFPDVTWIGATTDVGLLPEPLSNRFPIQPRLAPYTDAEMASIAERNAVALGLACNEEVFSLFAGAARGVPRQVNDYMLAAQMLTGNQPVTVELAREVVEDLCSTTLDGLTESMQIVLRFLRKFGGRQTRDGVIYKASVGALATAAGHGRDTKAINLLVEPALIQMGFLTITPGGRQLTDAGIQRAEALLAQSP